SLRGRRTGRNACRAGGGQRHFCRNRSSHTEIASRSCASSEGPFITTMSTTKLDRREFLKSAGFGGAALVLGLYVPGCRSSRPAGQQPLKANAWVVVAA